MSFLLAASNYYRKGSYATKRFANSKARPLTTGPPISIFLSQPLNNTCFDVLEFGTFNLFTELPNFTTIFIFLTTTMLMTKSKTILNTAG